MEEPHQSKPTFSTSRKYGIGFHVTVSILAAMALAAMVNYLGQRHTYRLYASTAAAQNLSPLTLQVLNSITNPVKVVVFFDRREPLFNTVSGLIKDYQAHCPMLQLEFVDYRMPGRAEAVRNQYKLHSAGESSRIIFDSGSHIRTILSTELSEFGVSPEKEIRRIGFKGEQLFTSALLNVTQTESSTAYFLQGHGEHDPRSDQEQRGYSRLATLLANNNISVEILPPLINREVPVNCSVLIVAAPETTLANTEINAIQRYLAQGGRLFVLFNGSTLGLQTGLEQILSQWDIEVGHDWVQDTEQSQAGETSVLITRNFGPHPIVRPLARSSLSLIMPRSIRHKQRAQTSADAPKVVEIALSASSARSLIPRASGPQGRAFYPVETNSIPIMAAAERGVIQGVSTTKGAARIVVCGDSLFLSNLAFNAAANSDFANLAINWLCNRDSLLNEIGPSPVAEYEMRLTEQQMSRFRWLFLATIPGVVMIAGIFVWLRRRS